jgi:hypothetical protein
MSTAKSTVSLETKSILKKRGLSELMLQRSLSSSSLLKRAAAAVQARRLSASAYPRLGWPVEFAVNFSSRSGCAHYPSLRSSISSSGFQSPAEGKRVRFDEQVGQCMALGTKGPDEGADNGKKTITTIPSTTLSDLEDIPKLRETSTVYCDGFCSGSWSSPSPSRGLLIPATRMPLKHSGDADDMDFQPQGFRGGHAWSQSSQNSHISESFSPGVRQAGIRATRTEMLVQYEDRDAKVPDGVVKKAFDTVNTAKDIASVIWNVGWR